MNGLASSLVSPNATELHAVYSLVAPAGRKLNQDRRQKRESAQKIDVGELKRGNRDHGLAAADATLAL
jgi:hypothetical protein